LDDVSGTIRGYRIFTACRTVNGKIFRLEDHLERLYTCAKAVYMVPPVDKSRLSSLLDDVVERNLSLTNADDLLIDVIFSGGLEGNTMKQSGSGAHLYIAVQEMVPPPPQMYEQGAVLATYRHQRMYPNVKLLNYVGAIMAHQTVVPQHEAFEVLFVCPGDGQTILEGSTFTIFFVDQSGEILTPPLDGKILDSVTRRVVLELLKPRAEFVVKEATITLDMVPLMSECFLVSTTRNVLPVSRLDDKPIGTGKPGPVTRKIMAIFEAYLKSC
jgi:branched-chain amino acid aminotransferase